MKPRFILFNRAGVYYSEDTTTGKQHSLRTKDKDEADQHLNAKNEAERQPAINLRIARANLAATDSEIATRTWRIVMGEGARLPPLAALVLFEDVNRATGALPSTAT